MAFENKLVAIVNKDISVGVAMNAVAHMSLGLGAQLGSKPLELVTYKDKDGNLYPSISCMPFIILRGKSNEIRKAIQKAQEEQEIQCSIFLNTMTEGTYQEQLDRTLITPEEQLIYYGAVLFGPWDTIHQITKRFSLYQ
jgi:hypothetical protein